MKCMAYAFILTGCKRKIWHCCQSYAFVPYAASIQIHCGVQADRESHVEDRLEVLAKISGGFTDRIRRSTPDSEGLLRRKHQVFVEDSTGSVNLSEIFVSTSPVWEQATLCLSVHRSVSSGLHKPLERKHMLFPSENAAKSNHRFANSLMISSQLISLSAISTIRWYRKSAISYTTSSVSGFLAAITISVASSPTFFRILSIPLSKR